MKLTATERSPGKKGEIKQLRREGKIPAILYSTDRSNVSLSLDGAEFGAIMRNMKPGRLPTTVFNLMINGKEKKAIVKDIQYQLTTYQVSHIDFEELVEDVPISVKVPIQCTGVADCVGVKLGGFLRQVIRHVKVECLPKHIPAEFVVDVKDLGIRQSKRLADIPMPKGVKPLAKMDEVVVVIAKRSA
jgi:large subunit ribosomal protein L25